MVSASQTNRVPPERRLSGLEQFVLRHRLPASVAIHSLLLVLALLLAYVIRFEISDPAERAVPKVSFK